MNNIDLLNWNLNPQPIPAVYNDGYSQYEALSRLLYMINQWIDNMNLGHQEIEELRQQKLSIEAYLQDIRNVRKIDDNGNFTGSWFGITKPVHVEGGIDAVVEQNTNRLDQISISCVVYNIFGDGTNETNKLINAINQIPEYSILLLEKGKTYYFDSIEITKQIQINLNGATIITNPNSTGKPLFWFKGGVSNQTQIQSSLGNSYTITSSGTLTGFNADDTILIKDSSSVQKWDNSGVAYTGRQELHTIQSVSGNIITLNEPLEYDYTTNPVIYKVSMLNFPKVFNGTIKEVDPNQPWVDPNNGSVPNIIQFDYCFKPTVEKITFNGWQLEAVSFRNTIDGYANELRGIKPFRTSYGGHGYLTRFLCSKGGLVTKCYGYQVRHLIDCVQSYDVMSSFNVSLGCIYGAFMCHGMGSKRYKSLNDTSIGQSGWGVGNSSFASDFNITIENPTFIGTSQAISIQCNSKNVWINNPKIYTPDRGISITTGANNIFINGGVIDLKYNTSKLESILIRPVFNIGDTNGIDPYDIFIDNVLFTGRCVITGQQDGRLELTNCKFNCDDANVTLVTYSGNIKKFVSRFNKYHGTFVRAVYGLVAPTDGVDMLYDETKYHTGAPIYIYAQKELKIIGCNFLGTGSVSFNGDISQAIADGAMIKANVPNSMNDDKIAEIVWGDADLSDNFNPKSSPVIRLAVTTTKYLNSIIGGYTNKTITVYSVNNNPYVKNSALNSGTNTIILKGGADLQLLNGKSITLRYFNNQWHEV